MEHIIASSMMIHLENNNILYDLQHGFRKNRSCETQLLQFIDDLAKTVNKDSQTDVVVMDFAKAFDKVSHKRLGYKLDYYGINGKTHSWITSFLEDRKQQVVVNGSSSNIESVT